MSMTAKFLVKFQLFVFHQRYIWPYKHVVTKDFFGRMKYILQQ